MDGSSSSPENSISQANIAIASEVKNRIFTPTESEDINFFQDPEISSVSFMTSHKDTGRELNLEFFKNEPANMDRLPDGLSLPAIMFDIKGTDDQQMHLAADAVVPTYSSSTENEELLTTTEYWFDMNGNARRIVETVGMDQPYEENNDNGIPQHNKSISEGKNVTLLDPGDYEVIEAALDQLKNGQYEEGEYSAAKQGK